MGPHPAPHIVGVLIGHVSGSVDVRNDSVPHVTCHKRPGFNKDMVFFSSGRNREAFFW